MDGVLVESMPYHYQAMKTAIKEVANIDLDKRTFYLLEGMPITEMALEILKIKNNVDVKNITNKDIIVCNFLPCPLLVWWYSLQSFSRAYQASALQKYVVR